MQQLEEAFVARLINLSTAHRHLGESNWQSANIRDLVNAALEPYCTPNVRDCELTGPDIFVSASVALSLTMVLHELATNAAKHGAFRDPSGKLKVKWSDFTAVGGSELELTWQEFRSAFSGVPEWTGYGTDLMEATAKALGGHLEQSFQIEGVSVRLSHFLSALCQSI
jgi:two-component sensor histidine kinase